MYTTGKYKFTYAVDGGYDTTAVRRNGDVNALRAEGGLYGKIKVVTGVRKLIFIIQNVDIPVLLCGIVSHMRIANGIQIFFQSSFKKISVMCTVCC